MNFELLLSSLAVTISIVVAGRSFWRDRTRLKLEYYGGPKGGFITVRNCSNRAIYIEIIGVEFEDGVGISLPLTWPGLGPEVPVILHKPILVSPGRSRDIDFVPLLRSKSEVKYVFATDSLGKTVSCRLPKWLRDFHKREEAVR